MNKPLVSVVMPVYNREAFLAEAIESILAQTYTNFEFIIVDDGSTDNSVDIIQSYRDPRIRMIQLPGNLGESQARNIGNMAAHGKYIAVMDSDDIAMPNRLKTQITYMQDRPEVGLCGCSVQWMDAGGELLRYAAAITEPIYCRANLVFGMPFHHPTWLVRKELFEQVSYRTEWWWAPDWDFMVEAAHVTVFGGICEALMKRREHPGRITRIKRKEQRDATVRISHRVLGRIGVDWSQSQMEEWYAFGRDEHGIPKVGPEIYESLTALVRQVLDANRKSGYMDQRALQNILAHRWWPLCRDAAGQGMTIFHLYRKSPAKWLGWSCLAHEGRMLSLCLGIGRHFSLVYWLKKFRLHS